MQTMNNIFDELNALQKEIESAKKNAAIFEGRLLESLRRLKEEFGLKSLADAAKEAGKLKTEIVNLEEDIQTKFKTLKETYAW